MFSEYEESIERFIQILGKDNPDQFEQREWELVEVYVKSDGCTGVLDVFKVACIEHDFYYRTHHDFSGRAISFMQANNRFRSRMVKLSRIGLLSPLAWWRWAAVCVFGRGFWNGKKSFRG